MKDQAGRMQWENTHKRPCTALVDGLQCALGSGHESPHRVTQDQRFAAAQAEVARLRAALESVVAAADDYATCETGDPETCEERSVHESFAFVRDIARKAIT